MPSICFVCLGNICRSPTAEGVFKQLIKTHGLNEQFFVDSAGTSAYHVGEAADPRSRAVAQEYGYSLTSRSRQVQKRDFQDFDLIVAMDRSNLKSLNEMSPANARATVALCRDFDSSSPPNSDVPDPYYGGEDGFLTVLQICERSSKGILAHFYPDLNFN
ncbi:MAG: phosphotyrosine protein phosphatase [Proteobacteria bacterium]|nr:phosphotyrosine protein phosphatase [Pseudomonadota bacterium]